MAYTAKYSRWITEEGLKQVEEWAAMGLTKANIAYNMGTIPQTLWAWEKSYPELAEAIRRGSSNPDQIITNALFERARGTTVVEEVQELNEVGDMVTVKRTVKQLPGDTTAQIFWLKNRMPDQWRDSQLTRAQVEKIKEETEVIKLTKEKLRGDNKDTTLLDSLMSVLSDKSIKKMEKEAEEAEAALLNHKIERDKD